MKSSDVVRLPWRDVWRLLRFDLVLGATSLFVVAVFCTLLIGMWALLIGVPLVPLFVAWQSSAYEIMYHRGRLDENRDVA